MKWITCKSFLTILVIVAVIDVTYCSDNETSTEGRRQGRVSGRIVKLYSGTKSDPIVCLNDGFQGDPVDCSVFYRCLKASNGKYTVYRFQCGPGTVYDPDTEVCNHPRSTKRLDCGGVHTSGLISSSEKYIENEINGLQKEIQELPSPITTKFPTYIVPNVITQTTTHATISKTDKSESSYVSTSYPWVTTSKPYSKSSSTSTPYPWQSTTYAQTSKPYVTNQPSLREDNQCTSDGFMGDSTDCRKFYRCVNNQRGGFIRYEFSCSELTVWDDDTQGCNHPWAVQRSRCGKSYDENGISYMQPIKNNELSLPETTQQHTQISYGTKVTQSQTQISNGPVNQTPMQINYGDKLNQEKHDAQQDDAQISNGSTISQSQVIYGSEITQTQLQVDHSAESSQTQAQISELDITSSTMHSTFTESPKYDGSKCKKDGFIGDIHDCKKFYRCISNGRGSFARQDFFCSEGTLWDEKLESCNHAWAVKNCGAKASSQDSPRRTTPESNPTNSYYTSTMSTVNNDVLNGGYANQNNLHTEQSTSQAQTTSATSLTTKSPKLLDTDCKSNGFYGNANDCAMFYRCVESSGGRFTKYEYKCGDGTLWDPEIESCNHAWAVKCNNGINKNTIAVPATEPSTVNFVMTTISLIHTTTQKNFEMNDYDTGYGSQVAPVTLGPTSINQGRECKSTGFMGDNNDCKKFYRCEEDGRGKFTRYEFTCGEGTVWDPKIQACNHAWAVETCGGSAIEDITISQVITSHPASPAFDADVDNSYTTHTYNNTENPSEFTTSTTTLHYRPSVTKDNECHANGFMGDKNDCKIFYRCVDNGKGDFTRYEFSCGDGTVWDPKIEACNHAWAVEKCGGTMLVDENTNKSTSTTKSSITNDNNANEKVTETTTQYTTAIVSSSTIKTSNGPSHCIANGFIGDPNDCKKFYRCVDDGKGNFLRYEFSCGEGTVWDSKIEACNHAWAVEACGGSSLPTKHEESTSHPNTIKDEETDNNYPTHNYEVTSTTTLKTVMTDDNQCKTDGFMGDTNDCKRFYRCVNDGKGTYMRYEFSCGDGTAWDSNINACNHINSVKSPCGTTILVTTEGSTTNNTVENSFPEDNTSTTTTARPPKTSNNSQCDKEGFIGDIHDCKKFYRCTENGEGGFIKYEFTCGEGTIWDQNILACNHASSDQHCNTMTSESHKGSTSSSSTETSTPITQTTQKTDLISNKDECSSEGFYASSADCKKFYRCVNDGNGSFNRYDFTCGDGTVWVQEIQACDHDSDASYCKTGVATSTLPSPSQEETQPSTIAPTIKTTIKSTPSKDNDEYSDQQTSKPTSSSENDCNNEGFYPNKNNCKEFYRCVTDGHGGYLKYEFACSEGTGWDTDTQSCNHISDVKGCQSTNQTGIQTNPIEQDEQVSSSNSTSTTERPSSGSTTASATTNDDSCQEAGYFGNSQDCSKFYRCVDNGKGGFTKYDFTCGDGTIWDQDITACNHPHDVNNPSCKNDGNIQTSTTNTNNNELSETSTTTTTTASTSTSSVGSSTQKTTTDKNSMENSSIKPENKNYTCTKAGFYADPYDCKKFYRCVDWDGDGKRFSIYHFDCGDGTIWDPELETCNHEESVYPPRDCNGAQSQNENNNGTTTTEANKQEETTQSSSTQETSAESTTQKSTTQNTGGESSTDSSSSTEQSTTQQSPSSEQTTSTEKSTTQQSTTEQTTSTEKSTTQQSTTEQTTSTQKSTTQQPSTQQSTTQQSSTTTQPSTTETSTTSTTTEQTMSTEQSTTSTDQGTTSTEQSTTTAEQSTTTTEQSTTSSEQTTSTTERTTTTSSTTSEDTTTTAQSTTSESTTTSANEETTKPEEATTQGSTTELQTSEPQSSTTEQSSTTQGQTEESSTTESGQETTTKKDQSSNKECPETDDDQYVYVCPTGFRRHPKYCNLFYQCTEDEDTHEMKVAVFNCPNNTIYDESKIQCVEEEKADKKCNGEIAQKRRFKRLDANYKEPIIVSRDKYSCPTTGHFPFEKKEECSPVLFKCEVTKSGKLRGFVYQCPVGYVYWSISRRCEPINAMTDCKHSYSNWTGRYEIPIERKNVAKKK